MPDHPNLPWPKINDYLMEIAAARDLNQLLHLALRKMGDLIPFDQAGIAGFIDIPGQIVYQETYGGSNSSYKAFREYYCRVMPDVGQASLKLGATDWYDYIDTEYVTDFIRPQYIRYSAGIAKFAPNCSGNLSISMNRSPDMPGFNEVELITFKIVQGHLANFCAMLGLADLDPSYPDPAAIRSLCQVLTRREAEVTALLCRKYTAEQISSRLLISPLTVYKHIENIYAKMKVNNRKSLRIKLLSVKDTGA